jgi:stage III sporulation protein AA
MTNDKSVFKYFPQEIEKVLEEELNEKLESLEEIRLRVNRPIIVKLTNGEKVIKYSINSDEILNCMQRICENSIYSYQNEIVSGYVTIKNGHRVGISGSCVIEDGQIININYIFSLNFRIAKEIIGSSNNVLNEIINKQINSVYNSLIVSAPGARKNNNSKRFDKAN